MHSEVNLQEVKEKLIDKLKASGWAYMLKGFIHSSDFDDILKTLYELREEGKRFTPPLKQVFSAFENCSQENMKVIIIGQDPYPQIGVADGMAFSCSNTMKLQPSLRHLFEGINESVYSNQPITCNPDLTRWAKQGVLLLNTALTCEIDKIGSHVKIWQNFIMYVLDILCLTNSGIIFILLGNKAHELESVIGPNHYVLKASHPASAAYTKSVWDCQDVFNKANEIIEKNHGSQFKIKW